MLYHAVGFPTPVPFCSNCAPSVLSLIFKNTIFKAFESPVSDGRVLIIIKRHVASFFELSTEEYKSLIKLLNKCKKMLDIKYQPDGYNVGVNVGEVAGQSVFHVHMHLIPRYKDNVAKPAEV